MVSSSEELTAAFQLLHLFHHRNKNQHRLAKWFKSLSLLRKNLFRLLGELDELDTALTYSTCESKCEESKYVKIARGKVEDRVKFMNGVLVEKCYLAFSTLVADNQYAALGLMLMGTLARVQRAIGPFAEEAELDVEIDNDEVIETINNNEKAIMEDWHDFGEVVKRRKTLGSPGQVELTGESGAETTLFRMDQGSFAKGKFGKVDGSKSTRPKKKQKELLNLENLDRKPHIGFEIEAGLAINSKPEKQEKGRSEWEGFADLEAATGLKGRLAETPKTSPTPIKKSKKRKKGDAFDDLFNSLI